MPAFLAMVESDEGYVGGVYFTPQAIHARRAVCDEWQDGEIGGATVKRMPHFDKYEKRGLVPMADMMLEGWWSECSNCWTQIILEKIDDDGNDVYMDPANVIGDFGGHCFCSEECHTEWKKKQAQKAALSAKTENQMKAQIESKFGIRGIEYTDFKIHIQFHKKQPFVSWAQLHFNVPGCRHGGVTYAMDGEPDNTPKYTIFCARGDQEAFSAFFTERTGKVLDTEAA